MNSKQIVQTGYDKASHAYRSSDADAFPGQNYLEWISRLGLRKDAQVLEIGCGCGLPVAERLAGEICYLGIDISATQIERAKQVVPRGEFRCSDIGALSFDNDSFDAIIALYSIIHIPLEEQPHLFDKIGNWLKPGGQFLATLGTEMWTGTMDNWLDVNGATMYWSHADAATYRRWLEERRFQIIRDEFVPERAGEGGHQLFQARLIRP